MANRFLIEIGKTAADSIIFLNGEKLTGVAGLNLDIEANEVPKLRLTMYAEEIELIKGPCTVEVTPVKLVGE